MFTTRVDLPTLGRAHVLFPNICIDDGFVYIDNKNRKCLLISIRFTIVRYWETGK